MRNWTRVLPRLFVVSLFLTPCIGLLTPVDAFAGMNYAVTFAQNDTLNDQVATSQTSQVPEALTLFANLVPAFTNSTETFVGWNTSANGVGTAYSNGQVYSFSADIILYAQWSAPFHTVTFAENASPTDSVVAAQTENAASPLTQFTGLTPMFQNANHSFSGWNTNSSGTGSSYSDGSNYSFGADLILYAQWSSTSESISFSANGGVGAISPVISSIGSSATIPSGSALSFANHSFIDWNTQPGGGGVAYQAGATLLVSSALTLYAQWATVPTVTTTTAPNPGPVDLVINFDADGATGVLNPVSFTPGSSVILPLASNLSNPGFTFSGWFTSAIGGQNLGQGGTVLTPSASETAFAQWTADLPATLSFSSNQGNGAVVEIVGVSGAVVTVSSSKGMLRQGYVFRGWNTAANASGSNYAIGSQFTLDGATTLYAQWSKSTVALPATVLIGSVGPFMNDSTALSGALRARIRSIAGEVHSKKYISISLYGYDAGAGSFALHKSLSTQRAVHVVEYLRAELARFGKVRIKMTASGEGEIAGFTDAMFRRVEIFAN